MLELAADAGIECVVGDYSLSQFHAADEVFVTGTMGGIAPVIAIDGRKIGDGTPGPVTAGLTKLLADLTARSRHPDHLTSHPDHLTSRRDHLTSRRLTRHRRCGGRPDGRQWAT